MSARRNADSGERSESVACTGAPYFAIGENATAAHHDRAASQVGHGGWEIDLRGVVRRHAHFDGSGPELSQIKFSPNFPHKRRREEEFPAF